jgi:hypothetical protein
MLSLANFTPIPGTSRLLRLARLADPADLGLDQQWLAQAGKRETQRDAVSWAAGCEDWHRVTRGGRRPNRAKSATT